MRLFFLAGGATILAWMGIQMVSVASGASPQEPTMHLISEQGSERATSSVGGALATRDGRTHIVWQDSTTPAEPKGQGVPVSPVYLNRIRTFDHATGELSEPFTLNRGVDNHARPNVVMDHDGYLHAIMSGHNSPVTYRRSKSPNDASAWTDPVEIGEGTYPVPVCAPDGTIYLTMRSAERWNGLNLFVKPAGEPWTKRAHLVYRDPEMPGYAAFHSGLAVSDEGVLHLVVEFYESKGIYERRGLHQAIAYMRSEDGGRTWTTAGGEPIELPARPERMDRIAQDRARARHEDMPPPVLRAGGSIVLDDQQRPHVLYIDHRMGPGRVMHATVDAAGLWSSEPIDAIAQVFPEYRPTSMRAALTRRADGMLFALLDLEPLDQQWEQGLPTRGMNSDQTRLVWLISNDQGRTWGTTEAMPDRCFYEARLERPIGGNVLPAGRTPPFVGFFGKPSYPEPGETIHNEVYLVIDETDPAERIALETSEAEPNPYRSEADWRAAVDERYQDRPAFDWPSPDPDKPNVLLIGDSISIGYTPDARRRLEDVANVFRIPDNGRSTRQAMSEIDTLLADPPHGGWNVIHFNWGIHDVTRMTPDGQVDPAGEPQVSLSEYQSNLQRLVRRMKATDADLIWANTTPVGDDARVRNNEDIDAYNAAAEAIMTRHYVEINDLHEVVEQMASQPWKDGVHFTAAGSQALAERVSEAIAMRITGRLLRPVLQSRLVAVEDDDGDGAETGRAWSLPLWNPLKDRSVRVSVEPAADNGDGWSLTHEPTSATIPPGEQMRIRIAAEVSADQLRYPLPEVVMRIAPAEDASQESAWHSARKRLPVRIEPSQLRIVETATPPRIDGQLDDAIWQREPTVPRFGRMDMQRRIDAPTKAWLAYDRDALYVAYHLDEPAMAQLQQQVTERDGAVYNDDSVELLVAPGNEHTDYYHLIVNPRGAIYDAKRRDRAFDIEGVEVATSRQSDGWIVETAVPWSGLEQPGPPERMRMLLARARRVGGGDPVVQQFPISPTGNHQPKAFAQVTLEAVAPAAPAEHGTATQAPQTR